jgi:hypothetical protein
MTQSDLPPVLAGPILRRLTPSRFVAWLAVSQPMRLSLTLRPDGEAAQHLRIEPDSSECRCLSAGEHLHYLLIDLPLDDALPQDCWISYSLAVQPLDGTGDSTGDDWLDWRDWAPDLCYPGRDTPGFVLTSRVRSLLHGSCRKPHFDGRDGLVRADGLLAEMLEAAAPLDATDEREDGYPAWPALLMLSGDQIYADDVAGPMLRAVHQLLARLGLPDEALPSESETGLASASELYRDDNSYYRREKLLPSTKRNYALIETLFGGVEKPVFTSDSAHNHLITLGEVLAMYLLVWSPAGWQGLDLSPPESLDAEERAQYAKERERIEAFAAELPAVRRLFAHLPVAMIFDDHDVTDDWNLSREWEEVAYGHPFSCRIIGNALLGYLLNQAWGNRPDAFDDELIGQLRGSLREPGSESHSACIEQLLRFDEWHYEWLTSPPLVVIDTRTHRWRSERAARQPSGLMDWEALTDLQQVLRDHRAVLLVSPAPIFGVKLIEIIQRLFTWFGQPLMVDAENWMAHPGAASSILNLFRHRKTPQHFVVLSGDVHYSFVYDVELRGRKRQRANVRPDGPDPQIWQICSSGLRNEFPPKLLDVLDRANRWLYSPRSPLNWLTRRRRMRVIPRKPEGAARGRRLLNGSGIGLVELDKEGAPWRIRELLADGRDLTFERREDESHWD